jgi:hypothetical protein
MSNPNKGNTYKGTDQDDNFIGSAKNDVLKGKGGNDQLEGGRGKDILKGGGDNDVLFGGGGKDRIEGGSGNDVMYGGAGRDQFIFNQRSGSDDIMDFQVGVDKIVLDGRFRAFSFDEIIRASYNTFDPDTGEEGSLLRIQLRERDYDKGVFVEIELHGVELGDITAEDFIFL